MGEPGKNMASGETIPALKKTLVELTLEWSFLKIWVLVAEITDEFVLGLKCRCEDPEYEHNRFILVWPQAR
jgi:hypothetical protein